MSNTGYLLTLMLSFLFHVAFSQDAQLYDEKADPEKAISEAVRLAQSHGQHVLIQAGGNWCSWCIRFDKFSKADARIDSILKASYQVVHLNYSKDNKNEPTFRKLGFPQRFGFPCFIILDDQGNRIHTQNSEYLEDGKGSYDRQRVFQFLQAWVPAAIDPKTYEVKK